MACVRPEVKKVVAAMKTKHVRLLTELRKNSRASLTTMSRNIRIPVSTLFDTMKAALPTLIKKNTCILDFERLGFACRAHIVLRVNQEERKQIREYLLKNPHVNSVYKINNGYDFLVEAVFRELRGLEEFGESLESKFRIKERKVYYIIEDIAREMFLTDPLHAEMVM